MRCVDCGMKEAPHEQELCDECYENNNTDTVIYKIPWQKYDPENPPELGKTFLVCIGSKTMEAELRVSFNGRLLWWTDHGFDDTVSHYAPINLPGEE